MKTMMERYNTQKSTMESKLSNLFFLLTNLLKFVQNSLSLLIAGWLKMDLGQMRKEKQSRTSQIKPIKEGGVNFVMRLATISRHVQPIAGKSGEKTGFEDIKIVLFRIL